MADNDQPYDLPADPEQLKRLVAAAQQQQAERASSPGAAPQAPQGSPQADAPLALPRSGGGMDWGAMIPAALATYLGVISSPKGGGLGTAMARGGFAGLDTYSSMQKTRYEQQRAATEMARAQMEQARSAREMRKLDLEAQKAPFELEHLQAQTDEAKAKAAAAPSLEKQRDATTAYREAQARKLDREAAGGAADDPKNISWHQVEHADPESGTNVKTYGTFNRATKEFTPINGGVPGQPMDVSKMRKPYGQKDIEAMRDFNASARQMGNLAELLQNHKDPGWIKRNIDAGKYKWLGISSSDEATNVINSTVGNLTQTLIGNAVAASGSRAAVVINKYSAHFPRIGDDPELMSDKMKVLAEYQQAFEHNIRFGVPYEEVEANYDRLLHKLQDIDDQVKQGTYVPGQIAKVEQPQATGSIEAAPHGTASRVVTPSGVPYMRVN